MPNDKKSNKLFKCFVCESSFKSADIKYHAQVNLPVCEGCSGTDVEANKVKELLEGLADGFVCGCI